MRGAVVDRYFRRDLLLRCLGLKSFRVRGGGKIGLMVDVADTLKRDVGA